MTRTQKLRALCQLRDALFDTAVRKWQRDGWTVKMHLVCKGADRHDGPCRKAPLAEIDEDGEVVNFYPHPAERGQPIEKTMLHEIVPHITLGLDGSVKDEKLANEMEDLLWGILTPTQRRVLRNLVGLETP